VDIERASPQRGGDLEPDEAGAEHHRAARSASCLDDPPAVSERTGNDMVHTKAVERCGVMLPGFGHDDLLCFPLAGADSNSESLQAR
jgi:hypothetical protein